MFGVFPLAFSGFCRTIPQGEGYLDFSFSSGPIASIIRASALRKGRRLSTGSAANRRSLVVLTVGTARSSVACPLSVSVTAYRLASLGVRFRYKRPRSTSRRTMSASVERSIPVFVTRAVWLGSVLSDTVFKTSYWRGVRSLAPTLKTKSSSAHWPARCRRWSADVSIRGCSDNVFNAHSFLFLVVIPFGGAPRQVDIVPLVGPIDK